MLFVPAAAGAAKELSPEVSEAVHLIREGWLGKSFFDSLQIEARVANDGQGLKIFASQKEGFAYTDVLPAKNGHWTINLLGADGYAFETFGSLLTTHAPIRVRTFKDGKHIITFRRKDNTRYLTGAAESHSLQTHEIELTFSARSRKLRRAEVVYGDVTHAKGRYVWRAPRGKTPASWEVVLPGKKGIERYKGQRLRDLKHVRN